MTAITLDPLAVDIEYEDGQVLTKDQLDTAISDGTITSITGYINTKVVNNMIQGFTDCFGPDYVFNDDGTPILTSTLFQKQNESIVWTGGDLGIGIIVDGGWVVVDGVNASISFTPEQAGQYVVKAVFTHIATGNNTQQWQVETLFRFSDGVLASPVVRSGGLFPAPIGIVGGKFCNPICITSTFNWTTTNPVTITLQKWVQAVSQLATQVVGGTATTGQILMSIEKI